MMALTTKIVFLPRMLNITYFRCSYLLPYLFNGRILSEASFISQMEGSIKKQTNPGCSIQTWRKTCKDILQTLQQSLGHGTSKTRGKNAE